MKSVYMLMPLLSVMPMLQSCSSMMGAASSSSLQPMMEVRNSSESSDLYYHVGRYAQSQNRLDAAATAYQRALEIRPDFAEAENALATVHAMQGRYDVAVERLRAALQRNPSAAYLHNNLGYILYLQGEHQQAIPLLERAIGLQPDYGRAHSNLALAYQKAGLGERARDHHAQATRIARREAGGGPVAASGESRPVSEPRAAARSGGESIGLRPARHAGSGAEGTGLAPLTVLASRGDVRLVQVAPNIYELKAPVVRSAAQQAPAPVAAPPEREGPVQAAAPLKLFRLEVSNGNGTTGMARRVAGTLRDAGLNPVRLTNQIPWQRTTEIQYAEDYAAEAAQLAALLRNEAMMIRSDRLRPDIKVRLVLGQDIRDETAFTRIPANGVKTVFAAAK